MTRFRILPALASTLALTIGLGVMPAVAADNPSAFGVPPPTPAGLPERVTEWDELVPPEWDPGKIFEGKQIGNIREGSGTEQTMMRDLREAWDNAPTRDALAGHDVRLPGYVVPLERKGDQVREFLLVPYFGACIHSPPPPANQILHIKLAKPVAMKTMDAVWASGRLGIQRQDSQWGMSGYTLGDAKIEPYQAPAR